MSQTLNKAELEQEYGKVANEYADNINEVRTLQTRISELVHEREKIEEKLAKLFANPLFETVDTLEAIKAWDAGTSETPDKAEIIRQIKFLFQKAEDTQGFSSHDLNKARELLETLGLLEVQTAGGGV
jgi:chaperonin cofactor prefoldin